MKSSFFILIMLSYLTSSCQPLTIKGKVINEDGEPIPNATITIKQSSRTTITGANGQFTIQPFPFSSHDARLTDTLLISATGYEPVILALSNELLFTSHDAPLTVTLKRKITQLDEAVVIAYGTTTRRFNTGNISKLSAKDITIQPVSNPLAALDGRIPGLVVTQSGGLPGASFKVQVRGQNSLTQGSDPLFIIDGIPFAPGNQTINQLSSVLTSSFTAGLSPFNTIDPANIESIEVLKDADATAIYGSRGANGVIIITTKKGGAGKTICSITASAGAGWVTHKPPMLNTQQYLQMRREAFNNDGIMPSVNNAPDLLAWDTSRYTDFADRLIGGAAHTTGLQASLSGGSSLTSFLVSAGYNKETTVFPGSMNDAKALFSFSLGHHSADNKLVISLSAAYTADKNNLMAAGISSLINLPPNAPALYDAGGNLNWEENGYSFSNPLAYLKKTYTAQTDNLLANGKIEYRLLPGLTIGSGFGYNYMNVKETLFNPLSAQNPAAAPKGSSQFGYNNYKSWLAEPQVKYNFSLSETKITLLAGASFQQNTNSSYSIGASGYTNDALMQSLSAAPIIDYRTNFFSDYRYRAVFGRISADHNSKYILNLSGRRDGSSRFGPANQFTDFWAAGAAWIFSKEKGIAGNFSFLSFGKLRTSYGTTGNDQIGDYKYLDAWSVAQPYQGNTALYPQALFNPSYGWEINKKWEAALELGFINDRILCNIAWFRNRSSNQLVEYILPSQTGFYSITSNFPALVQNTGWEIVLNTVNIKTGTFTWSSAFNISVPRNKLLAFPGLASSAYAYMYVLGQPLSVIYNLHATGVDPASGVFSFDDYDKDGTVQSPADYRVNGNLSPVYYGGFGNALQYKSWRLQLFVVFRKQKGESYTSFLYAANVIPGAMYNQPVYVWDRWQSPGDLSSVQKFTASTNSAAYQAASMFRSSDGLYSDASFIRLKTVALSWSVPGPFLNKYKLQQAELFCRAQNLFTITGYKGSDPETQNLYALPPLKMIEAGIHFTF